MFKTPKDRLNKIKAIALLLVQTVEAIENKEVQFFEVSKFIEAQAIKIMQLTK